MRSSHLSFTSLLTSHITHRPKAFELLIQLFSNAQLLKSSSSSNNTDTETDLAVTQIDFEEQAVGYQAAYSKLSASEVTIVDPVGYVNDPRVYLVEGLNRVVGGIGEFREVIGRCDGGVVGPFLDEGRKIGLQF